MKRLIEFILVLTAIMLCLSSPEQARAETYGYARIMDDSTYFYSEADEDAGLFLLPRTYFVQIIGDAGDYYQISYLDGQENVKAVKGYCKKSQVTPVSYLPQTPYLVYRIQVTYSTDEPSFPDGFLEEITLSADYYGAFYYGSALCYYVYLNGSFGYVPASACSKPDYPENTEFTDPPDPSPVPQKKDVTGIVLTCILASAAILAVWFLFRPQKNTNINYSDDTQDIFR